MDYKGYEIIADHGHYVVIAPDGKEWTEDTLDDAKRSVDEES